MQITKFRGYNYFNLLALWLTECRSLMYKFFLILICIILVTSCNSNDVIAKELKSLDSISGALNQKIVELKKTDTIILEKALTKFNYYKQFIKQNINDTVSIKEADALKQFFASGNNLEDFYLNRKFILARAQLVNSQLGKLILDLNENTIEQKQLQEFSFAEKEQASDVIQKSFLQQQLFQTNLQQFKTALPLVEDLIKANNNGQLPTIVKDTTSL